MEKISHDPIKFIFPAQRLNKTLRTLIATNTTLLFVAGMFGPFYAVFVQKIGGSFVIAGLSWALFGIVTGVLTLLFSRWELRINNEIFLLALSYGIRTLVFLSYAFMYNLPQLLITQILWGVAAAIGSPAFDTAYSSHTDHKQAVAQWASWEGISSIASGTAALVGGFIVQTAGFQPMFVAMSVVTFFLAIYLWRLPRLENVKITSTNADLPSEDEIVQK